MEYIVFIHNNTDTATSDAMWNEFFATATASGLFQGGSEIRWLKHMETKPTEPASTNLGGFMRFVADSEQELWALLEQHPVYRCGGTLEICEMPKSS